MVSWTWVKQNIRLENCSVWACGGDMKRLQAYMKYMDFKHRFQFKNMNSLDLATVLLLQFEISLNCRTVLKM